MVADALRYTQEARSPRSIYEIYVGSSPILNTNGSIVQLDRTYLCERYNVSSNLTGTTNLEESSEIGIGPAWKVGHRGNLVCGFESHFLC